jgi:plastocyanin
MTRLGPGGLVIVLLATVLAPDHGSAADFTVVQKNKAFSVSQIEIKVGDRITFLNSDTGHHNVLSETKGTEFNFRQAPGRSDTVRFTQAGTVVVECAIHPDMRLEVLVRR